DQGQETAGGKSASGQGGGRASQDEPGSTRWFATAVAATIADEVLGDLSPGYSLKASTSDFNFFKPPTSEAQTFTFRIVATASAVLIVVAPSLPLVAATFSTIWRAFLRRPFLPLIFPLTK